jgi:uncharacterized protein YjiS (DUF1127 family)
MHSSVSVNRVVSRNNAPSGEEIRFGLRGWPNVAYEKLTPVPRPDLAAADSLPGEMPSMTAADRQKTGIWSSIFNSLMEGFALYGASVHPTACFPVMLHSNEGKILQPRDISRRQRRGFVSLVSTTASHDGTVLPRPERDANQATPAGFEAAFADDSLREPGGVTSLHISRPSRWNWLTLPREAVVILWTRGRRERKIRRAAAALAELDDRTLQDMGIPHRSHIEQVVRYCHDC